jgi:hypothetical protein
MEIQLSIAPLLTTIKMLMPFALLIIGIWLLVAGVRNTAGPASQPGTLFALLHGDFTGSDNFAYWFIAIILIGAIGYIPKLKGLSTAFLALVIVVLFLKKGSSTGVGGGFFDQFISGIGVTNSSSNSTLPTTSIGTPIGTTAAQQASITQQLQQQLQQTF